MTRESERSTACPTACSVSDSASEDGEHETPASEHADLGPELAAPGAGTSHPSTPEGELPAPATRSRASSCSAPQRTRRAGGQWCQEASSWAAGRQTTDEELDAFLGELFPVYAGARDNGGRPLMDGASLRRFFRDFAMARAERVLAAADGCYADEIQRQVDLNFRFDLSKAEAKRGLCFQSFMQVLNQAMTYGMARTLARQRFDEYAGDALAMREKSGGLFSARGA